MSETIISQSTSIMIKGLGTDIMKFVRFFGTTGDKNLMFQNKLMPGGGIYIELAGKKIIMDPGPGTFSGFIHEYPGKISQLDAVILSHVHFDHSTDVNAMIEGMTDGGKQKKGKLITLRCAYNGESRVIQNYLKGFPAETCLVDEAPETALGNIRIVAVRHRHGIPNYGYRFFVGNSCVSVVTDTEYFEELPLLYSGSTSMIIYVPYAVFPGKKQPKHLCIENVKEMLTQIRPKITILTHFGANIYEANVGKIAKSISEELGLVILSAETGRDYKLI